MVGVFTVSAGPVPARGAQVQRPQRVSLRPVGDDSASWLVERGDHEEEAQRLARCSIELAGRSEVDEIGAVALELMRTGNHDPATLQHALVMCRSLLREDPSDQRVKRAIRLLQHVTKFLGVPPRLFDARLLPGPEIARAEATAGARL